MTVHLAPWLLCAAAWLSVTDCCAEPKDYMLGAGDVVRMTVYQYPDLTSETRIGETGNVTFPLVGTVSVAGKTAVEVATEVTGLLADGGFIKKPQVNVQILQFHSQQISVLGQVTRPGKYPLDTTSKITDVIATAGGVSAEGGDEIVLIRTEGDNVKRYTFDSLSLFDRGNAEQNIEVKGGDIIYVPRIPLFYIYGAVQHPGTFRLQRDMTVMQALSVGGGLTPRGTERGIKISRHGTDGQLVSIDAGLNDKLQIDDVVYVKESFF